MSGRQDKALRRADRYREAIVQAHDRLHKDDVGGCHEVLHAGLGGARELPGGVDEMGSFEDFDRDFREVCVRHNRRAAFVALDGETRMLSGGDVQLSELVDGALRAALMTGAS